MVNALFHIRVAKEEPLSESCGEAIFRQDSDARSRLQITESYKAYVGWLYACLELKK